MKRIFLLIIIPAFLFPAYHCSKDKTLNYKNFPKIDTHVHIRTSKPEIINFAREENFRLITICTRSNSQEFINKQLDFAKKQHKQSPQTLAYLTTFSMEKFGEPGWSEDIISQLKIDVVVYLLSNNLDARLYELDLIGSVKSTAAGEKSVAIGNGYDEKEFCFDLGIKFPGGVQDIPDEFLSLPYILPAQIIGFYKSLEFGLSPDSPSKNGSISRVVQGVKIYPKNKSE